LATWIALRRWTGPPSAATASETTQRAGVVIWPEAAQRRAAKRFFRKLLKGLRYSPRVMITDKLCELRGSTRRDHACGRAPKGRPTEQSSGEFASADAGARTTHASVQVRVSRAALSFGARTSVESFPSWSTSTACLSLSSRHAPTIRSMASHHGYRQIGTRSR